jgi:hypothetical protein
MLLWKGFLTGCLGKPWILSDADEGGKRRAASAASSIDSSLANESGIFTLLQREKVPRSGG